MSTVTSTQAATGFPIYSPRGGGDLGFTFGVYEIASALSASDVIDFCRLPVGRVVDGFFKGDDIDSGK